ncbi:MAG: exodeoxyribonuclease V subunit alpha, partial [Actinomycetes bacterium]
AEADAASPTVTASAQHAASPRPLRLVGGLLYLERYWEQEQLVREELARRSAAPVRLVDADRLRHAIDMLFPEDLGDALFGDDGQPVTPPPDYQRLAAAAAALGSITVIAGGPGTGKTTTVARLLSVVQQSWSHPPRIAMAAPTGKAAARLQSAVAAEAARLRAQGLPSPDAVGVDEEGRPVVSPLVATTLHRLLGARPDSRTRFKHHRRQPLPYDLIVVDETSMVSLTLMARLLEAVRPEASLVLVGDPDQLASVEAGAVLGDLVARAPRPAPDRRVELLTSLIPNDVRPAEIVAPELRNDVVRLRQVHRFSGAIAALADSIREGDGDTAVELLQSDPGVLELVDPMDERGRPLGPAAGVLGGLRQDIVATGQDVVRAALAGECASALAALDAHRLLVGHRRGPFGLARWSEVVEGWLRDAMPDYATGSPWYPGRPLIATRNDPETGLSNGDTGVVVSVEGVMVAAFTRGEEPVSLAPTRLSAVETMHALTVHRSQGSQFARVSVVLPPPEAPLLTRELLYTAVTRATSFVRVLASEEAVRAAVARPIVRASGLRRG